MTSEHRLCSLKHVLHLLSVDVRKAGILFSCSKVSLLPQISSVGWTEAGALPSSYGCWQDSAPCGLRATRHQPLMVASRGECQPAHQRSEVYGSEGSGLRSRRRSSLVRCRLFRGGGTRGSRDAAAGGPTERGRRTNHSLTTGLLLCLPGPLPGQSHLTLQVVCENSVLIHMCLSIVLEGSSFLPSNSSSYSDVRRR